METYDTNTKDAILWWENSIRSGKTQNIPSVFFSELTSLAAHNLALQLFRHAYATLGWTPYEALNLTDRHLICELNLERVVSYIQFPPEIESAPNRYQYIVIMCYPEVFRHENQYRLWEAEYVHAVNSKGRAKLTFTDDESGVNKAKHLLNMCLRDYPEPSWVDIKSMYLFFADKKKALRYFKKVKLTSAYERFFVSPLQYFHESIPYSPTRPDVSRSGFLYMFAEFQEISIK